MCHWSRPPPLGPSGADGSHVLLTSAAIMHQISDTQKCWHIHTVLITKCSGLSTTGMITQWCAHSASRQAPGCPQEHLGSRMTSTELCCAMQGKPWQCHGGTLLYRWSTPARLAARPGFRYAFSELIKVQSYNPGMTNQPPTCLAYAAGTSARSTHRRVTSSDKQCDIPNRWWMLAAAQKELQG